MPVASTLKSTLLGQGGTVLHADLFRMPPLWNFGMHFWSEIDLFCGTGKAWNTFAVFTLLRCCCLPRSLTAVELFHSSRDGHLRFAQHRHWHPKILYPGRTRQSFKPTNGKVMAVLFEWQEISVSQIAFLLVQSDWGWNKWICWMICCSPECQWLCDERVQFCRSHCVRWIVAVAQGSLHISHPAFTQKWNPMFRHCSTKSLEAGIEDISPTTVFSMIWGGAAFPWCGTRWFCQQQTIGTEQTVRKRNSGVCAPVSPAWFRFDRLWLHRQTFSTVQNHNPGR